MAASQRTRKEIKSEETKAWLEEILSEFNRRDFLYSDPLSLVHAYERCEDQELVALVAALFSFGNVKSILKCLESLLRPLGDTPSKNLLTISDREIEQIWAKSYYRFYASTDIIFLFRRLKKLLSQNSSLEDEFLKSWNGDTLTAIDQFRTRLLVGAPKTPGMKFMFADPHAGTAKRWHMFLRWVVRNDDVDLGLWTGIPKSALIQPLDTHLFHIGRGLKLTTRSSPSLAAALEMTEKFRQWNPEDPIKYDFALCRLGVLGKRDQRLKIFLKRAAQPTSF